MFTLLCIVAIFAGIIAVIVSGVALFGQKEMRGAASLGALVLWAVTGVVVVWATNTGGGSLAVKQFFASSKTGHWLVVDNSGGRTMRHWLLENAYVEAHDGGAGWQFYDANGNLCYVAGDAFVMQILQPLDQFRTDYKRKFNIPEDQPSLK